MGNHLDGDDEEPGEVVRGAKIAEGIQEATEIPLRAKKELFAHRIAAQTYEQP